MNILFITHCDPRAMDFGSAQRSHLVWEALKKLGSVYTVYNVGPNEPLVRDESEHVASWHLAPSFRPWLYAQALFSQWAAPAAWPFRSRAFIRRQLPWKGVKFDAVVVRYLGNVAYSTAWNFGPVFVDIDDLPVEAYDTVFAKKHSIWTRWFWHTVVSFWQKFVLKKCRATWIANPNQVNIVQKIIPCSALPNLAMPPKPGYQVNSKQKQQLMTVGLMSYEPNYQGVDWFVTTIWPKVHEKYPDMTYAIAGGGCPEDYRRKWEKIVGVKVLGFVKDLDALYEESLAVVTPILSGAGTCIKVIEAAVHGRRVLATSCAIRGLTNDVCEKIGVSELSSVRDAVTAISEMSSYSKEELRLMQNLMSTNAETINSPAQIAQIVAEGMNLKPIQGVL